MTETTTLKMRAGALRRDKVVLSSLFLVFAGFAAFDFIAVIQASDWLNWDALTGAVLTIAAIGAFKACIRLFRFGAPEFNTIGWNGEGLSLTALGRRENWPWWKTSSFEITKMRLSDMRMIRFAVPAGKEYRSPLRWFVGPKAPPGKTFMYIGDAYEIPLEEVAAHLNASRHRALPGNGESR